MSIFVVTVFNPSGIAGDLASAIQAFDCPHLKVADNTYLLSHNSGARALAEQLGITEGTKGTGLVTEMASYWGRGDPGIWSWINQHWGQGAVDG